MCRTGLGGGRTGRRLGQGRGRIEAWKRFSVAAKIQSLFLVSIPQPITMQTCPISRVALEGRLDWAVCIIKTRYDVVHIFNSICYFRHMGLNPEPILLAIHSYCQLQVI